jgi:hypothetical protein
MHASVLLFGEWTFFCSSLDSGKVLNPQISVITASLLVLLGIFKVINWILFFSRKEQRMPGSVC